MSVAHHGFRTTRSCLSTSALLPDLTSCYFWLVSKIKIVLKGKRFDTIPDIERATGAFNHGTTVGISTSLAKENTLKEIKSNLL
ncbi:hypothetical protein ILUMI_10958 [Ignelater luminosus]|uniref:Uncharacterized protein n=1 Tax=Ignelater luminosus TaxID=2038154 RepID=A0A8K0D1E2_IGNLU|nr:hypothetical protein ILUMI_10958 [Ignelater luminosus]